MFENTEIGFKSKSNKKLTFYHYANTPDNSTFNKERVIELKNKFSRVPTEEIKVEIDQLVPEDYIIQKATNKNAAQLIADGDVIATSSPISNPKILLKSLPIEIVFSFKFLEPKNFSLFEISSSLKSFFK